MDNKFAFVSIVAIVAVVALVVMIGGQKRMFSHAVPQEVYMGGNVAGQGRIQITPNTNPGMCDQAGGRWMTEWRGYSGATANCCGESDNEMFMHKLYSIGIVTGQALHTTHDYEINACCYKDQDISPQYLQCVGDLNGGTCYNQGTIVGADSDWMCVYFDTFVYNTVSWLQCNENTIGWISQYNIPDYGVDCLHKDGRYYWQPRGGQGDPGDGGNPP